MELFDLVKEEFFKELATKASWGKNEVKALFISCEAKVARDMLRAQS